jgi:hypothetical protein
MTEVRTQAASVRHTAALFLSKAKRVQERKQRAKSRFGEIYSLNRYNIKLGLTYNPFSKKGLVKA